MPVSLRCIISSLAVKSPKSRPASLEVIIDRATVHQVYGVPSHTQDLTSRDVSIDIEKSTSLSIRVKYRQTLAGQAAITVTERIDVWNLIISGAMYSKPLGNDLGTLQLQIRVVGNSDLTREFFEGENPEDELPTMAHIRAIIRNLPALSDINGHLTDIIFALLSSLWTRLETQFGDPFEWIRQDGTFDYERQPVDPENLRYVTPYDLLVHIRSQTDFMVTCLDTYKKRSFLSRLKDIAHDFLVDIVHSAALVLSQGNIYYAATHSSIRNSPEMAMYTKRHYDLLYHRVRMLLLIHNDPTIVTRPTGDESRYAFLDFVYSMALGEIRASPNWRWSTYTASLLSLRSELAQDLMSMIGADIDSTEPEDTDHRDLLRRLLAHVVSSCDEAPYKLLEIHEDFIHMDISPTGKDRILIGRGGYGEVFAGLYARPDEEKLEPVALKCLHFQTEGSSQDRAISRQNLLFELIQWSKLKHDNVLPLIGLSFKFDSLTLVSPFMERGNARTFLQTLAKKKDYEGALWHQSNWLITDIAKGLRYLHSEGIIHGDLRGVNVLVNSQCTAIISDFGLSLFAHGHSGNYNSKRSGHPLWAAPEIMENGMRFRATMPADIYSFAMVCVELYTLDNPFTRGQSRPSRPRNPGTLPVDEGSMEDGLWQLVQKCWDQDPTRRPTADGVLKQFKIPIVRHSDD